MPASRRTSTSDELSTAVDDPKPPRRGDVFWVVPDPTRGVANAHPYVVLSEDVFNRSRICSVVVCALTSNLQRGNEPGNVRLHVGEANLTKPSVIVVSQLASVPKAALGTFIGTLSPERVEQALDGLRFQQHAFFGDR